MPPRLCRNPDFEYRMAEEKSRILLIVFIAMSQFSSSFMYSIMGVTLPNIGRDLGASGVELGLAESVFLGTAAALLLPIGRFADATDKNTLFKWGLLALGLTTFAVGLQPTIESLIAARFVQGIAAPFLTATSVAIVADIAPRNQLGRMLGLAIGATYVGLASGPFFAGFVTTHLGWRWVFYLAATPPLLSWLLSRVTLESKWRAPTEAVNLRNAALLIAAIFAVIAGGAMLKQAGVGIILTAVGACLGGLFFIVERRSANPLLAIEKVIRNNALSRALSVQFLIYCGTIGTTFLLSLYLQLVKGNTPETAGHFLVLAPVVMAVVAPLAGRLADRVPPRLISATGAASILCSVVLAVWVDRQTGAALIVAIMAFQGIGFALFSAPNLALIMNSVPVTERGMASALSAVMRSMGMVTGMFIATAFLAARLGDTAIQDNPVEFLGAMRWTFVIFATLTAAGVVQAGRRHRALNLSPSA